jgi:hypothetical protein
MFWPHVLAALEGERCTTSELNALVVKMKSNKQFNEQTARVLIQRRCWTPAIRQS